MSNNAIHSIGLYTYVILRERDATFNSIFFFFNDTAPPDIYPLPLHDALPIYPLPPDRLSAVLAVVYLIFNEGYGGRGDLAAEAIRLGRALADLMPDEPEVHGLLALMLVNDARREALFADGTVVLLRDQDRRLWDLEEISQGRTAL